MFRKCTALSEIPDLPASQLADNCYEAMFDSCIRVTKASDLKATQLSVGCYKAMFRNCSSLNYIDTLVAYELSDNCYDYMFQNCKELDSLIVMFHTWGEDNIQYTYQWLDGVKDSGVFIHPCDLDIIQGISNIPEKWQSNQTVYYLFDDREMMPTIESIGGCANSVQINRTFYLNGNFNTLSLPFSLDSDAIVNSPLSRATVLQLREADIDDLTLNIHCDTVHSIKAGYPYLIFWDNLSNDGGDSIVNPIFYNVEIDVDIDSMRNKLYYTKDSHDIVRMYGTLDPYYAPEGEYNHIYWLDGKPEIYWPCIQGHRTLKGFRSYFITMDVNSIIPGQKVIINGQKVPMTYVLQVSNETTPNDIIKYRKNGMIFIKKNNTRYSVSGLLINKDETDSK